MLRRVFQSNTSAPVLEESPVKQHLQPINLQKIAISICIISDNSTRTDELSLLWHGRDLKHTIQVVSQRALVDILVNQHLLLRGSTIPDQSNQVLVVNS